MERKEKLAYLKQNKLGYIYLLLDPRPERLNEIRYVGETERDLLTRYQEHLRETGTRKSMWVQKLLRLGYKPIHQPLCIVSLKELDYLEDFFIGYYAKIVPSLLNDARGGVGGSRPGRKMPKGFGAKISKALKGRVLPKEHVEKIRAGLKGKKKSSEHCKKIGAIHKGKVVSEETRKLISKQVTGRPLRFGT